MLDFYQWFPMNEGMEWFFRVISFGGLILLAWYTRTERREYKERAILREHQQVELFAIIARNLAAESMVLSFRVNGISLHSDFISWYNRYMGWSRRNGNFFVFND